MKRSETRDQISMAFLKLAQNTPVENIKIKDIVSLSGINKSTYYYNFNEISEIKDYTIDTFLEDMIDAGVKASENTSRLFPELPDAYTGLMQFLYDNRRQFDMLTGSFLRAEFIERLLKTLSKYFESWHYDPTKMDRQTLNLAEQQYRLDVSAAFFLGLIHCWHSRNFEESPQEAHRILIKLLNMTTQDFSLE